MSAWRGITKQAQNVRLAIILVTYVQTLMKIFAWIVMERIKEYLISLPAYVIRVTMIT
jgi:hypothetical protein